MEPEGDEAVCLGGRRVTTLDQARGDICMEAPWKKVGRSCGGKEGQHPERGKAGAELSTCWCGRSRRPRSASALVAGAEVGSSLGQGAGAWGLDLRAADGEVFQQLPGSAVCG